ncbi:MAG: hypothetical protein R2867_44025 [Caldilineaceae bacterium]
MANDGLLCPIPRELEEAGLIDGCNRFQVFLAHCFAIDQAGPHGDLPVRRHQRWNEYLFAYVLISKQTLMTLPVGLGLMIIGDVQPWVS